MEGIALNKKLGGLEDDVPIAQNSLMRVRTTGGGGWGNPLARDMDAVRMDVWQNKVSVEAARDSYGVVFSGFDGDEPILDEAASSKLRDDMVKTEDGDAPIIDRGPGLDLLTPANPDNVKMDRYG